MYKWNYFPGIGPWPSSSFALFVKTTISTTTAIAITIMIVTMILFLITSKKDHAEAKTGFISLKLI